MKNDYHLKFDDTSVAFSSKSNRRLRKMHLLFSAMNYKWLMQAGNTVINFLLKIRMPIKGLIKHTVFEHFCGGEDLKECEVTISELAEFNIGAILDYSVEGAKNERGFDETADEVIRTIGKAKATEHIPFSVFKFSGIASFDILEKIQKGKTLTEKEQGYYNNVKSRIERLCKAAHDAEVRLFIDAEETWVQDVIDELVYAMMAKFNKEKSIVYNTFQMYRRDMLENLKEAHVIAEKNGYFLGAKLVRGAYMEKERDRAEVMNYESPIQPDKTSTDRDFDAALAFCIKNRKRISLCAGSHNELSNSYLVEIMHNEGVERDDAEIYFAQLYGMSDNISFKLAKEGYNVVKYVPYGPVQAVLPYLYRRSQENSSVAGQSSRELSYIKKEIARRKR